MSHCADIWEEESRDHNDNTIPNNGKGFKLRKLVHVYGEYPSIYFRKQTNILIKIPIWV